MVKFRILPDQVARRNADRVVGINVNYIRDADANRPQARPLASALREMGVRWIRYPGGGKSDRYRWSTPPYDKPGPVSLPPYDRFEGERMGFDEFIALCRSVGAEPFVVVAYDGSETSELSKEQWIESAAQWVRYANIKCGYSVRYWEVGNENWNGPKGSPEVLAAIVAEYAAAMKQVDPSIQIGASGHEEPWWNGFLPLAAPHLDFVSLSLYTGHAFEGHDYWLRMPVDLGAGAKIALDHIDRFAPDSGLKVIVCETNSTDYSQDPPLWAHDNTLGHALVTFDTLGQCLINERVLAAMVWNTRWMKDEDAPGAQYYALGPLNEILPSGRAIELWGRYLLPDMVKVEGGDHVVSAYSTVSEDRENATIWVLNRSHDLVDVAVDLPGPYQGVSARQFTGFGPDDREPTWRVIDAFPSVFTAPPLSVTVFALEAGTA